MNGKFFWLLVTLIFVLIGHLGYVLFYPGYEMQQKFDTGFAANGNPGFRVLSDEQAVQIFPAEDPTILEAVCPFDVSESPVKISIVPTPHYWSLSIYSQSGDSYYSINDKQAVDSKLNIFIRTGVEEVDVEKKQRELVPDRTEINAPSAKGWAVLRFQIYNRAARNAIAEQAKAFKCEKVTE